ncbi:hypothetical protein FSARC_10489 [Fusarium sarcochroum]|uniref:Uncharacterized protein n=1 Tax=Fusarium sarcochroum TaxID=1208366 RepID=A0A8H4TMF3_9HYPO|nr:hypothetical protein FSARC_10489 [Fusarium sarcochroum]
MPSQQSVPSEPTAPTVSINLGQQFQFGPTVLQPDVLIVTGADGSKTTKEEAVTSLDALDKFKGTFAGFGFNTIFRPNSTNTKTPPELKFKPTDGETDNLLQLNLTAETMVFAKPLGNVPNRGLFSQPDINLNGVPYTQTIVDAMDPTLKGDKIPVIHFEPGLWMRVPAVDTSPKLPASYARMASIPHGTTIHAQCFDEAKTSSGPPKFEKASIVPIIMESFGTKDQKETPRPFLNQKAAKDDSRRLPQQLGPFIKAGTITQEILDNPNVILEQANRGKDIVDNTTFTVVTEAPTNNFGGGTSNIGFLVGVNNSTLVSGASRSGNANAAKVKAFYWISTVRAEIQIQPCKAVDKKIVSQVAKDPRDAVPSVLIDEDVPSAMTLKFKYNQIQYSQDVTLDFFGVRWPHITVATLAPTGLLFSDLKKGN